MDEGAGVEVGEPVGDGIDLRDCSEDGLVPAEALVDVARGALHFERLDAEAVLETRLLEAAFEDTTVD